MKKVSKNIPIAVICWIMSVAVAVVIFMFSCDTGEESAEVSESLLSVIIEFIGRYISHNFLRKLAHFCEFAALGFFVSGGVRFTFANEKKYIPFIICLIYSASDEIHQFYVPERACKVFDIFIDSCGAFAGIIALSILIYVIEDLVSRAKIKK